MLDFWTKLKIWTKVIAFVLLVAIIVAFITRNTHDVEIWLIWRTYNPTLPLLLFITFLLGVITPSLVKIAFRTARQLVEMRKGGRMKKLEKEMAGLRAQQKVEENKPEGKTGV